MPMLPDGDPAPSTGRLPRSALATLTERPLAIYLHVPFCRVRCGYCDFNTYTLGEVGSAASPQGFVEAAVCELELARGVLGPTAPMVDTIFVGGGTPTLLPASDLARLVSAVREHWGLAPGAEVTTEANPDSVTPASLRELAACGFTRVSFGMQSAVPHVLATLERTHDPTKVSGAVAAARDAGLAVSLDLIYGTPGETPADWEVSLRAALALAPDHLSAYALTVEDGTRLAGQVRRGEVDAPDPDDEAHKYAMADDILSAAGFEWYEISNWSRSLAQACRHNLHYWSNANWWGIGPGAHSHVGGVRWWNVKHPAAYAARLTNGLSPAAARELLTDEQREDERVLLGVRLVTGLALDGLNAAGRASVGGLIADGLVDGEAVVRDRRVVLTRRGRLLADVVVHHLLGVCEG